MKEWGIDLSTWQGDYNLAKAQAEGVKYVIIRGGSGEFMGLDNRFIANYNKAKSLNMPVGVYWYSEAFSTAEAEKEAAYFYDNCIKGRKFELPVYMDVEGTMLKQSPAALTEIIKAFCNYLEARGCFIGVYASEAAFKYNFTSGVDRYSKWVANWTGSVGVKCALWQFGGTNNPIRSAYVAGQITDQNYLQEDLINIIKSGGFNGYGDMPDPEKTIDQLAHEVIEGKWGNGAERKQRLEAAGYNYYLVQNRVNELLYEWETDIHTGDMVIVLDPINYDNGKKFTLWYPVYEVMEINGNRAVIGVDGVVTAPIDIKYLRRYERGQK